MSLFYCCLWSIFTIITFLYFYSLAFKNLDYDGPKSNTMKKVIIGMLFISLILSGKISAERTTECIDTFTFIYYCVTVVSLCYPLKLIVPDMLEDFVEKRTVNAVLKLICSCVLGWLAVYLAQVAMGQMIVKIFF